jgi:RNAse (barnase) inhibitor barstar
MAVFKNDSRDMERLDWRLLQNGAVTLYHRAAVLTEDSAWFQRAGYKIHTLDAARWTTPQQFHEDAQRTLAFPSYYGKNLAAWIDHLAELAVPDAGGVVLQFKHYDVFAKALPQLAQTILDSVETTSRRLMLVGRRLIALVQSDDPRIRFERVGAVAVTWNPREWSDNDRLGVARAHG